MARTDDMVKSIAEGRDAAVDKAFSEAGLDMGSDTPETGEFDEITDPNTPEYQYRKYPDGGIEVSKAPEGSGHMGMKLEPGSKEYNAVNALFETAPVDAAASAEMEAPVEPDMGAAPESKE